MIEYYTDGKTYYKANNLTCEKFELTEAQYNAAIKNLTPVMVDTNMVTVAGYIQKRVWK